MNLVAVYLHPEDVVDDVNLHIFQVESFDTEIVRASIERLYDVEKDSFHYYEPTVAALGNGVFDTVDDAGVELRWRFETVEF